MQMNPHQEKKNNSWSPQKWIKFKKKKKESGKSCIVYMWLPVKWAFNPSIVPVLSTLAFLSIYFLISLFLSLGLQIWLQFHFRD